MKTSRLFPYIVLVPLMLLILLSMTYIVTKNRQLNDENSPLIIAVQEIQKQSTLAHLWLEEMISGDTIISFNEISSHVSLAHWYTNSMLEGGANKKVTIIPIKSSELRHEVIKIQEKLLEYDSITTLRWNNKIQSGIGSEIDQIYDGVFKDLNLKAEQFENYIIRHVSKKMNSFYKVQLLLIISSLLLFVSMIIIIRRSELSLRKERIRLKKTNGELTIAKEQAEKSDHLKSAFLANMSHEIRTPMNSIVGFAKLLKRGHLTEEKRETYLDIIDSGGKKLLNIISDIVDISKIDAEQVSIQPTSFNLNRIIDILYEQFSIEITSKDVLLKANKGLENSDSYIETDETRLTQILSNLLENAKKFTKSGSIEFGYSLKDEFLQFYVKDTGIGIEAKDHQLIFERFAQVENDYLKKSFGTGLGLSISKGLVELLNGRIWVESELNKGSTFYFTIPYIRAKKNGEKVKESIKNIEKLPASASILIADDNIENFIYFEDLLKRHNWQILHALNGREAVDMVKNNSIDLVLMDIKMPVMNGLDATREIRKTNKKIKIVAQTAYAMNEDRIMAIEAGCDDYLAKPISANELLEVINKYV